MARINSRLVARVRGTSYFFWPWLCSALLESWSLGVLEYSVRNTPPKLHLSLAYIQLRHCTASVPPTLREAESRTSLRAALTHTPRNSAASSITPFVLIFIATLQVNIRPAYIETSLAFWFSSCKVAHSNERGGHQLFYLRGRACR